MFAYKRLIFSIFSPYNIVIGLFVLVTAMAGATFIENDFGSEVAYALVYNAWWFEMFLGFLAVGLVVNIFKYRLLRLAKLPILLFHLGFIVILLGAAITRYTSYGGVMRIRENTATREIISDENYLQLNLGHETNAKSLVIPYAYRPWFGSPTIIKTKYLDKPVEVQFKKWIPDGLPQIVPVVNDDERGVPILQLMIASGGESRTVFVKSGEIIPLVAQSATTKLSTNLSAKLSLTLAFLVDEPGVDKISNEAVEVADIVIKRNAENLTDDGLVIQGNRLMSFLQMSTQEVGRIPAGEQRPLLFRTLYNFDGFSVATVKYLPQGVISWESSTAGKKNVSEQDDIMVVQVAVDGNVQDVGLHYKKGYLPVARTNLIGGLPIRIAYGAIAHPLPFELYLEEFTLERYPGSASAAAYESKVIIRDGATELPYTIFVNHVLDYRGYRFFQASYDSDERGTVLSVNHDAIGMWVSYLGYLLMGLGMLWTLLGRQSRFWVLTRELKHLKTVSYFLFLSISVGGLWLMNPVQAFAQEKSFNNIFKNYIVDKKPAIEFGKLLVQDLDGRIKPINTLASEFLRKLTRSTTFTLYESYTLNADQVFLSLFMNPTIWKQIPLIKTEPKKWGKLQGIVPVNRKGLVAFNALLDKDGNYLLAEEVKAAKQKKPAERNVFDQELIKVDERFNILFSMLSGVYLRIFPKRDDPTKTWYSFTHDFSDFSEEDGIFAKNIIPVYFGAIQKAMRDQDWTQVEEYLAYLKKYQNVLAPELMPSDLQMQVELWYNRLDIFYWNFQLYWLFGTLLLSMIMIQLLANHNTFNVYLHKFWRWVKFFLIFMIVAVWITQSVGLLMRWYIAERPPWTDGYEMIVFAGWALVGFGFYFNRRSGFALPLAALFAGALLFVSYLDWLNPEITQLMPVLKSYWLKIHVAVIISSYAPLAISALLGIMALILLIVRTEKNEQNLNIRIKELIIINELSMTVGLFLLSIGTFLGAIWANESWGRYWAWDPKETWSLISIVVYVVVLHLRLIPAFRGSYVLNTASVFAFFSIIMTSFGVNYYLTGLHSYATGDPLPIPVFMYFVVAGVFLITTLAFLKEQLLKSKYLVS